MNGPLKTLMIAPEVFRAEGGIARILRAYLHALLQAPQSPVEKKVGLVVMNDDRASKQRIPAYLHAQSIAPLSLANRSKIRFVLASLRHGFTANRIICGHLHQAPVARFLKLLRPKLKYYIVAHGIEVWRSYSRQEKSALLNAERILCVSDYSRRQILHYLPTLDPQRLLIVPNTLDPDFELPELPSPRRISNDLRILSVGRLTSVDIEKGFESLIKAMPLIRAKIPQATLRIAGGGNDLERLRALANENGGPGVIDLLGRISDEELRAEYKRCDFFAMPSRKEGFGLVYLEAMSFGKPCLAARAGGAPEVVNDDVGALVEYGNLEEIAEACCKLYQRPQDPEKMRAHLQKFSFAEFTQRLNEALTA